MGKYEDKQIDTKMVEEKDSGGSEVQVGSKVAIFASLAVNIIMVIIKVGVWIVTRSDAIFAACLDGIMDVISQVCNFAARKSTPTKKYPMGRDRTSCVGCIICSTLMICMALSTILKTVEDLVTKGIEQPKDENWVLICLCTGIGLKFILFIYCYTLRNSRDLDQVLCQDHMNDVLTNSVALVCQHFAANYKSAAFLDSVGAILICIYILISWIPHVASGFKRSVGHVNIEVNEKVNEILNYENKPREQDRKTTAVEQDRKTTATATKEQVGGRKKPYANDSTESCKPTSSEVSIITVEDELCSKKLMNYPFKLQESHVIWSGDQVLVFLTYQPIEKSQGGVKLEEFIKFKQEVEQNLHSNIDIISRITIDLVA